MNPQENISTNNPHETPELLSQPSNVSGNFLKKRRFLFFTIIIVLTIVSIIAFLVFTNRSVLEHAVVNSSPTPTVASLYPTLVSIKIGNTQQGMIPTPFPTSHPFVVKDMYKSIPKEVLDRAHAYINSKVGEEYFKENYELDYEKSLPTKRTEIFSDNSFWYCIQYKYRPLVNLQVENDSICVMVKSTLTNNPFGFVAYIENDKILEPSVKKEMAIQLAVQYGLSLEKKAGDTQRVTKEKAIAKLYLRNVDYQSTNPIGNKKWEWEITNAFQGSECQVKEMARVNAITGQVQIFRDPLPCP